jgi:hypothetical protein
VNKIPPHERDEGRGGTPGRRNITALNSVNFNESSAKKIPTARYRQYPPVGRRAKWLVVVENCPGCAGCHTHRSDTPIGRCQRSGSCGRRYWLVPARGFRLPNPHQLRLDEAA